MGGLPPGTGPRGSGVRQARELDDPALLVDRFAGRFDFLSNFYRVPVLLDGVVYPSSEHAFNALKTDDPAQRETVRTASTPARAKAAGRRVSLRVPAAEWDAHLRFEVMREVVRAKFTDPDLRAALLSTGDALLIEGTGDQRHAWHDQVWGQCYCAKHRPWAGGNHLGRTLMAERARVRGDERWTRVAVTGHRPRYLDRQQSDFARAELRRLAVKLRAEHATQVAISGMALGSDTWWADAAVDAGLDLWAYVPFWSQPDGWALPQASHWGDLLDVATRHVVLGESYDVRLLHSRNDFMLRDCDLLIAVHDPARTGGGTASTLAKARAQGTTIVLVDVAAERTTIERPLAS